MSEDRVLEEVILAPHVLKRLIEPEEVAPRCCSCSGPAATRSPGRRS